MVQDDPSEVPDFFPSNDPWDIAAALLFLSTPLARHITGQAITVDGGACNTVYDVEQRAPRRGSVGSAGPR